MKRALFVCAALLLVLSFTQSLNAQRDRDRGRSSWVFLGDKHVDGREDHDKISIGRSEGRFRELQIRVREAPVRFERVVVHFENGEDEELRFRDRVNAGDQTRPLDLRGYERTIKSVEFWYEKVRARERRPTVELYGRR